MFLHLYPWTTMYVCIMHTADKMRLLEKENAWILGRNNLFLWCFRVYSTCLHYLTKNLTTLDSPLLSMMSDSDPSFPDFPWVNPQRTLDSCHEDLMWKIGTAISTSFVEPTFDPIFTCGVRCCDQKQHPWPSSSVFSVGWGNSDSIF